MCLPVAQAFNRLISSAVTFSPPRSRPIRTCVSPLVGGGSLAAAVAVPWGEALSRLRFSNLSRAKQGRPAAALPPSEALERRLMNRGTNQFYECFDFIAFLHVDMPSRIQNSVQRNLGPTNRNHSRVGILTMPARTTCGQADKQNVDGQNPVCQFPPSS